MQQGDPKVLAAKSREEYLYNACFGMNTYIMHVLVFFREEYLGFFRELHVQICMARIGIVYS